MMASVTQRVKPLAHHLPHAASKLSDVGTTIFTVMSQLASECGAINLSQGFPDFPPPAELLERVARHLRAGHNQYAPMAGLPELRAQIALKTGRLYGRVTDPESEVTVTSGATEALFCAIQAFVGPGDEMIVFDPAYDSYEPAARLAGARTVHVPLAAPGFTIDWQRVTDALTPRTRLIVLNSPHNPTGAVVSAADLDTLAGLVRDRPLIILGDEVYEHIVFDGLRHESLLRHPELSARSVVVSSFGKTFHATGWKIGYCVAPPALTREFRKIHQFVQFCVVTPIQHALAEFLECAPGHYLGLSAFYQEKRDLFCRLLAPSRFRLTPSRGTYFQLLDYGAISAEDDAGFARRLTREAGVAGIPVSVFCAEPGESRWLRFCFAKEAGTLEAAAEVLCRI
jgi:methionine aminotransferase